jgi:hypothetical protein
MFLPTLCGGMWKLFISCCNVGCLDHWSTSHLDTVKTRPKRSDPVTLRPKDYSSLRHLQNTNYYQKMDRTFLRAKALPRSSSQRQGAACAANFATLPHGPLAGRLSRRGSNSVGHVSPCWNLRVGLSQCLNEGGLTINAPQCTGGHVSGQFQI